MFPARATAELPLALKQIEKKDPDASIYTQMLRRYLLDEQKEDSSVLHYKSPERALSAKVRKPIVQPKKVCNRKISTSPFKVRESVLNNDAIEHEIACQVLDAPALQDDFYLNLVDWSSNNVLVVGLGSCVYLWSASTSKVTKLCDLADESNAITSVCWATRPSYLAVGTRNGDLHLYDTVQQIKVRTMSGHSMRVGTLAWAGHCLASGSRDRSIVLRDHRASEAYTAKLQGHRQEVCGLRWSFDESHLASGGNDNKLLIWNSSYASNPIARFSDHNAAVKALAWSPHQQGLLASGGGTADRCIRFWNTLTCTPLHNVDTGSQVCNLMWSKNVNEVVSTHGYSLNQIIVWSYPTMTKLATLTGHTYRVLYLAMSPDGQTIVTGAGDETLRFWNIFPHTSTSCWSSNPEALSSRFTIR